MQALLHICDSYGSSNNIVFNTKKTTCLVVGNARNNDVLLLLNNQKVPVVETFKYLGVKFVAKKMSYVLMFHLLRGSFMLHVIVCFINVKVHVKLFKFI